MEKRETKRVVGPLYPLMCMREDRYGQRWIKHGCG
ncbi:hypothetical protein KP509_38G013800 [Ceratopteris richardii]|uniref:Uncharacterized protein n=1 Tax=Ceratopteris richardii TaxID=49495 RepID=A0A8T2Q2K8_CERRI|nr:hypothetical protein KP509_38G013800 [Ceratopteris richardii]